MESAVNQVLTISPGPKGKGGIASVIKMLMLKGIISRNISTSTENNKLLFFIYSLIRFLSAIIINRRIKIVHIHSASYNSFKRKYIFFLLSHFFKKIIIFHIHGAEFHLFYNNSNSIVQKRIRRVIENSDYVFCLSESWKKYFNNSFKCKNIIVINNIVDYVEPKIDEQFIGFPIVFLFLGYIGERKGIFDLVSIISKNKEYFKDRVKILVGGNGQIEKLKNIIVLENLETTVEFLGWVDEEEKKDFLNKSNVFILPSYNEGLPIAILEAMAHSLPIISTSVGGIPEIVDETNGILIRPGIEKDLFSAIDFFIKYPENINLMGKCSYSKVKKFFPEMVKISILDIYKHLLEENNY